MEKILLYRILKIAKKSTKKMKNDQNFVNFRHFFGIRYLANLAEYSAEYSVFGRTLWKAISTFYHNGYEFYMKYDIRLRSTTLLGILSVNMKSIFWKRNTWSILIYVGSWILKHFCINLKVVVRYSWSNLWNSPSPCFVSNRVFPLTNC